MRANVAQLATCSVVLTFAVCIAKAQDVGVAQEAPGAGIIHLIAAAESGYFENQQRYAPFADLVQSGALDRAAVKSSENLQAFHVLDLQPGHELINGLSLGLMVAPDNRSYKLSLTHKTEPCAPGWFADSTGAFYEGRAEGCVAEKSSLPITATFPSTPEPSTTASAAATATTSPGSSTRSWAPPDIDQGIPPVRADASCPLPQILKEASRHAEELVDNLQRFSATERIDDIEFRKDGRVRSSETFLDSYVAQIAQASSGSLQIEEYRSGSSEEQQPPLADVGTAAFALIFHPHHIDNFDFRCEGLAELHGVRAWQVHFEESADSARAFHALHLETSSYKLRLKGRAWIAAETYEVLQLETDLVSPLPQIALQMEHMKITYAPVEFKKRHLNLWLPDNATMYIAYRGHRYERIHNFSQFQLFWIDTEQMVKDPVAGPAQASKDQSVER